MAVKELTTSDGFIGVLAYFLKLTKCTGISDLELLVPKCLYNICFYTKSEKNGKKFDTYVFQHGWIGQGSS